MSAPGQTTTTTTQFSNGTVQKKTSTDYNAAAVPSNQTTTTTRYGDGTVQRDTTTYANPAP
ncbi:MAG: hypothetical protein IVW54_13665 [Candidatus Binataceae bacterium]|nr:hypothetical protein [Candidatus Binataceae bacterium]